ncbi:MAG TPA: LysR family transcriptional regulator substrate-binding protein, partial [Candidatus Binataceae bacterium]
GYERDISTRKASDRILRDYGVKPNYAMEFDNIETIKRAVEIGLGIAIVPRLTAEAEMGRGTLKIIDFVEGTFTRPLAIIYKRGRELSPAVRKFVDVLTSHNLQSGGRITERGDRPHESNSRADRVERGERPADRSEKAERPA